MYSNLYQALALRTATNKDDAEQLLLNGVLGLCGEAGEVSDIVKKYKFQGHDLDIAKLIEELGDVLWYVAITCRALGVELGDVMQANINKLNVRYPQGFDSVRSRERGE